MSREAGGCGIPEPLAVDISPRCIVSSSLFSFFQYSAVCRCDAKEDLSKRLLLQPGGKHCQSIRSLVIRNHVAYKSVTTLPRANCGSHDVPAPKILTI
jgi:hypothetical protein